MATYVYDDFRVTFTPRDDGSYDVVAADASTMQTAGHFELPFTEDELRRAVLRVARTTHMWAAKGRRAEPQRATRDVGEDRPPTFYDGEQLGGALATALMTGSVGEAYDRATAAAHAQGRGIRLTLSLAGAPELLSVPWEFVYRRPRFLASQRQSPVVRLLDTGTHADAPTIRTTVRILGVIASPRELTRLNVEAERRRVELALQKVRDLGRVELEWLEPATPRTLREALRDGQYHVLHYVGHSAFTDTGDGLLFLEDANGGAAQVDSTALANLLSDETSLRLVVLNSCEGARTTLTDPYAGVATTLVQLGVPAVVAMQFEISDEAAILFAEELYINLIGRQDPIDAAVSEARKALFIELDDRLEWATPVLFVRNPDVELFRFEVPEAPLAPLRSPTSTTTIAPDPVLAKSRSRRLRGWLARVARSRGRRLAIGVVMIVAIAVASVVLVRAVADDGSTAGAARPRTGFLALQLQELGGAVHLYTFDRLEPDRDPVPATMATGAVDTQPAWDRNSNRLAFTHELPESDLGVFYVVPGNGQGDRGKQVAPLIVDDNADDSTQRLPAWGDNGVLFYVGTSDCRPGPGCADEIHRATFTVTDDAPDGPGGGYWDWQSFDTLTVEDDKVVASALAGVKAIAADPTSEEHVAVLDDEGLSFVTEDGHFVRSTQRDGACLAFTPSGTALIVATLGDGSSSPGLVMFSPEGVKLFSATLEELDSDNPDYDLPGGPIISLTPGSEAGEVMALVAGAVDTDPPVLAAFDTAADGLVLKRSRRDRYAKPAGDRPVRHASRQTVDRSTHTKPWPLRSAFVG